MIIKVSDYLFYSWRSLNRKNLNLIAHYRFMKGVMRIDKFLKNSRLIKRRTVAKEACDQGRISINGKPAKAGTEVKVGDIIHIEFGNSSVSARILELCESCKKEAATKMYEIIQ